MKTISLFLGLLLFSVASAQTDSTEIKLKKYKAQYSEGLISAEEYQMLKSKVLGIEGIKSEKKADVQTEKKSRFDRKVMFHVRLNPVFFFDIKSTMRVPMSDGSFYKSNYTKSKYGGLHVAIGPAINKRFHPNFTFGVEVQKRKSVYDVAFPIYTDFNLNILKKKYSPFIHGGLGYYGLLTYESNKVKLPSNPNDPAFNIKSSFFQNGGMLTTGIGINIHADKIFSIGAALDYRFAFTSYKTMLTDTKNPEMGKIARSYFFQNQLGTRLIFIFY